MGFRAPAVYHVHSRPDHYRNMAIDAAKNMGLRQNAIKLLVAYAESGNGFRPSLKFISESTGLDSTNISRYRMQLAERGLIDYVDGNVYVKWEVIRAAAIYGPIAHSRCTPVKYNSTKPINKRPEFGRYKVKEEAELTENQLHLLDRLEHMTEQQYYEWLTMDLAT